MNDWFKARNIWGAAILALSDAEAGRLMKALWTYTMTGEQQNLSGAEKAIFAMILMTLGQDEQKATNISAVRAAAGSTGGKQTQANSSKRKQNEQTEANASNCSNKNKNKEIEEEIDNNYNSACARENPFTVSEDEMSEALERDRKIEDASRAWGLPCNEGNMIKARDMAREYSLDWLLRAIETAGNGKEQTWRYVAGILKSWKENGGPDAPKKQRASPGKTVSAQRYGQREYTEDELNSVGPDIIADAERERAYQESVVLETTDETMNRLLDEAKEQRSTA